ncbi:MAG: hypothetical protein ACYCXU_01980 [Thermoleophilia bacterium]
MNIWSGNPNLCGDWLPHNFCVVALREEYLRRSCRVCSLANDCWPGMHEDSPHSVQSGQTGFHGEKSEI